MVFVGGVCFSGFQPPEEQSFNRAEHLTTEQMAAGHFDLSVVLVGVGINGKG
ncbi:hypothetical protein QN360_09905 [Glaciimonas sp. CA11.2]|uniref:hypothetical protein n=1 Tax=unclassified Glaciimonas TaxID=2644401 RepID=UPI002B22C18F|nr:MULTISPECIES: hypothetical protein [unclassified Glaciimonas]MEB0083035.1 hypothetical protein [Glaciimonas sp. Gout2]MEB0163223.1 hypothetical protein [Glaciimonas sp. CA11.2]